MLLLKHNMYCMYVCTIMYYIVNEIVEVIVSNLLCFVITLCTLLLLIHNRNCHIDLQVF